MSALTGSGILSVHLEGAHSEAELLDALCSLFGLRPDDLAPLDRIDAETPVSYQVFHRPRGFRTTLELYVGRAPDSVPRSDTDLATALVRRLRDRALIPPRDSDSNPYAWDLIAADEPPRRVHAVAQDDDEAIVIDEGRG